MHSVLEILEETTDSAGPDLISLADLKFALNITDNTQDAQLQAAITFQSRMIAEYCDRRFGRAEVLETFTMDPGERLPMRQALTLSLYPISAISEISNAGATGQNFEFDPASGRVWTQSAWWWYGTPYWPMERYQIAITYSGGYDLPEDPRLPARLQKAVIQAVDESRTTGSRDAGIREVQHGDTRVSYFTPTLATSSPGYLSAITIDLIKPFRRISIA